MKTLSLAAAWLGCFLEICSLTAAPGEFFGIRVVDQETKRGVPLVELRTVHQVSFWTDSDGWIAFNEPGLMDEPVFFSVKADGYEFLDDPFGFQGFSVRTTPGGRHEVEVRRTNVAERLYRLTGAGIFRDSVLLGLEPLRNEPLLNSRVMGQDCAMAVEYRGRTWWFWGDTLRPAHPLGNFHMTAATALPAAKLEPERSIDYTYLENADGFVKRMSPVPGEGPTWLSGFSVIQDQGEERLIAGYAKIQNQLETYERGLVLFNDEEEVFEPVATFSMEQPPHPIGHAIELVGDGGTYIHFQNPFPLVRVRPDLNSLSDPTSYQAFTPLVAGSRRDEMQIERDEKGRVVYDWKTDTPEVGPREQETLVATGLLVPEEQLFSLRDWQTGDEVQLHAGSVHWNPYRKRWVLIVSEIFGNSLLGEIWFAEADSPWGPWVYGIKIVSHRKYTFYNPRHHSFLDRDGGRIIYFEGTYTALFSGVEQPTPRYDYNQILYRIDLTDPRLDLPVAVYRAADSCLATARSERELEGRPLFWAWEKAGAGRIGLRCEGKGDEKCRLIESGDEPALFFALDEKTASEFPHRQPLEETVGAVTDLPVFVFRHPMPLGPVLPPRDGAGD